MQADTVGDRTRWIVLAVLFTVRTSIGFQFQSLAVAAPFLPSDARIDYATLGFLMGAYMLPGIVVAFPGGLLGQRFGEKRITILGLGLMVSGGLLVGLSAAPGSLAAGRIVSGTGAVLLNVSLTKMVTDWFVRRELVLAMGVLASSWSLGIGLSLLAVPVIAGSVSVPLAMSLPALMSGLALLLVAGAYRPPPEIVAFPATLRLDLSRREWGGAILSGLIWALFNAAFSIVLVFGPSLLAARGQPDAAAAATVSLVNWAIILTLPFGGHLAALVGSATAVMVACFLGLAAAASGLALGLDPALACVLFGLVSGPVAGLIMVLPGSAVEPRNRAAGMGLFFALYYVAMATQVPLAGALRDRTHDPSVPLHLAAGTMLVAALILALFRLQQRR